MFLKIEHFLVAIIAVVGMVMFILIIDRVAAYHRNKENHRYDSQFSKIEELLAKKEYNEVLMLADTILSTCGNGTNDMKARCLQGLVYVNRGEVREARDIIFYLEETYPVLNNLYVGKDYTNEVQQRHAFESILQVYIPALQNDKGLDTKGIFSHPEIMLALLSLAVASVAAYEKMINKRQTENKSIYK